MRRAAMAPRSQATPAWPAPGLVPAAKVTTSGSHPWVWDLVSRVSYSDTSIDLVYRLAWRAESYYAGKRCICGTGVYGER